MMGGGGEGTGRVGRSVTSCYVLGWSWLFCPATITFCHFKIAKIGIGFIPKPVLGQFFLYVEIKIAIFTILIVEFIP